MLIRDRLARDGNFLFRWRSYAPLLLLPLILFALPEAERIAARIGPEAEHIVFYLAMLVSFAGLAIRWVTIAFVPPGTSGRNTLSQRADQDRAWAVLGATTLALFLLLRFLKTQTRLLNT
jgi:hypothetical protein